MELETINDQLVAVRGEVIVVLRPKHEMTKPEAIRFAAWLVALADDDGTFPQVLTAVRNT